MVAPRAFMPALKLATEYCPSKVRLKVFPPPSPVDARCTGIGPGGFSHPGNGAGWRTKSQAVGADLVSEMEARNGAGQVR
jgi:hypothetical protein